LSKINLGQFDKGYFLNHSGIFRPFKNAISPVACCDMKIIHANSPRQIDEIRSLFREYESFLDVDLSFQQFESELESLPGKYAPPSGVLLLGSNGQEALGCGALRRFGPTHEHTCEMKRLYVRPKARGLGLGKKIASQLIQEAVCLGYCSIVLDTLYKLEAAIKLYKSLGFVRTGPYYDNPLSGVIYWKLDLRERQANKHLSVTCLCEKTWARL
jgi:ribosomal protein S18 acetylase RimI-like enzyme